MKPGPRRLGLGLLLAAAACSAVAGGPPDGDGGRDGDAGPMDATHGESATPPESWEEVMERIDADHDRIRALLQKDPPGDLAEVAARARRAASHVGLGHGRFESPRVPGFADLARACQRWFDEIAREAEQGNRALARALLVKSEEHCTRCHDRSDPRPQRRGAVVAVVDAAEPR